METETTANPLKMAAGRELDRMVVEKVFGHETRIMPRTAGKRYQYLFSCYEGRETWFPVKLYSTDHDYARSVRQWIQKQAKDMEPWRLEEMLVSAGLLSSDFATYFLVVEADLPLTWCRIALALAERIKAEEGE